MKRLSSRFQILRSTTTLDTTTQWDSTKEPMKQQTKSPLSRKTQRSDPFRILRQGSRLVKSIPLATSWAAGKTSQSKLCRSTPVQVVMPKFKLFEVPKPVQAHFHRLHPAHIHRTIPQVCHRSLQVLCHRRHRLCRQHQAVILSPQFR